MKQRDAIRLRYLATLFCVVASVAMLVFVVCTKPQPEESRTVAALKVKQRVPVDAPTIAQFQAYWNTSLRRPFEDPVSLDAAPATEPEKPPPKRPNLMLSQILYSDSSQLAVFESISSKLKVTCGVGNRISNAVVARIERDRVVLNVEGTEFEFQVSKKPN